MKMNMKFLSVLLLIVVLALDIVHSIIRNGFLDAATEALGILLVASSLSLIALLLRKAELNVEHILLLVIVAVITIVSLFGQTAIYSQQREYTKSYLRELVLENGGSIAKADVLKELVDADFIPISPGNALSGNKRAEVREIAARWLNENGIKVKADDLIVPPEKRFGVTIYIVLGTVIFLALGTYIWIFSKFG